MTHNRSPLEERLSHIRTRIVVTANAAYLLYVVLTALTDPAPFTVADVVTGLHRTRYWGGALALAGLLAVWAWPRRVRTLYLPYLLALLLVSVAEVISVVANHTMPFHLALWLSANMAIVFLVYGTRDGVKVFGTIITVILMALLYSSPITGDLLADWITTLIVMTVAGSSSYLLMSLIESNMLINERTIDELRTARIDVVTGVPGRAIIEQELQAALLAARQTRQPLSVIMTDIDHFKAVNDRHGHRQGDLVLRGFAARLVTLTQPHHGVVGRWGGEEFLVILPGFTHAQALAVARTCCRDIGDRPVAGMPITASFGVSSLDGADETAEALFSRADHAMYSAKHAGRNRVG